MLRLAVPIMLAQVAVALTGVVDTGVMGRFGDKFDLAAVGIGSVTIAFGYWAFGFLRMSTTGLTAQATGRNAPDEVNAVLQRALGLGLGLGLTMAVLLPLVANLVIGGFEASPEVAERAYAYVQARALGAPAALMGFGIMGWLLGRGRTTALLGFQVVLNLVNIVLDVLFVAGLGYGPAGLGLGTALAEWTALGLGLYLVRSGLGRSAALWELEALRAMFAANVDILVRTLALLTGFAWFVRAGNRLGPATAAGNEVLLQFITVSAFVLDAFAFVAEKEVGEAYGARDPRRLLAAIRVTSGWSLLAAIGFSAGFWLLGRPVIHAFVADPEARDQALAYLGWTALVPVLGFVSWELDGVFLGALRGRALRNAAVASTLLYIALDVVARPWGNAGVWSAFLGFYVLRAACLAPGLPGLLRDTQRGEAA